jgi:transposase-like protein
MTQQRKRYSAELKAKVALEAIKGHKTANEIASAYGVHPTQIAQWKKQVLDELPHFFSAHQGQREKADEALIAALYQEIGQLKVELDWLKKTGRFSPGETNVDRANPSSIEYCAPMRSVRTRALELLLSGSARKRREPAVDALTR